MGYFRREQPVGPKSATSWCASEIARHTAILGSVAAAFSNPVKEKHYYLALDGTGELGRTPSSPELRGEARIVSAAWEKRRVKCEIAAFNPDGSLVAKLTISYAVVTEPMLLMVVNPVPQEHVFGTPWQAGEPSPYEDPIQLRMVKMHSSEHATAIMSLHNRRNMAGHFSVVSAAPIAMLMSNGLMLCRKMLEDVPGKLWCDMRTRIRCQRMVVAGEMIELRAKKVWGPFYSHRVEFVDEEGKTFGVLDHLFKSVPAAEEKARL